MFRLDNYHNNQPYYFNILPNCFISDMVKNNQIWEKYMHNVFEKYITSESVVIECGCHIGIHTIKIASLCHKLYAFEPMPETNKVLNENILLNCLDNVIVFQKGVSNKIGKTKYSWIEDGNPGGSGLDNNPMGIPPWIPMTNDNIEVELTTIDSLDLDKLDFMKIDVEGYETLVIEGAMNTIIKCKPIIIMEVWKDHFGHIDIDYTKSLFKNLLDIGYSIEYVAGPDFLFIPNKYQ